MIETNSIEGSAVLILYFTVAASDSHECVASIFLAFLRGGNFFLQLIEELLGLVVAKSNFVCNLLLLDTSHFCKLIEG